MNIYAYGIVDSYHTFIDGSIHGVDRSPVYMLFYLDIGMVVSDVPSHIKPTQTHLIEHEKVIENLMEDFTVLPMRFPSVYL